jgi:hypothetical protein
MGELFGKVPEFFLGLFRKWNGTEMANLITKFFDLFVRGEGVILRMIGELFDTVHSVYSIARVLGRFEWPSPTFRAISSYRLSSESLGCKRKFRIISNLKLVPPLLVLCWLWHCVCQSHDMTINAEGDWQTLCGLIANEQDPERLSDLVNRLLRTMDERKKGLREEVPHGHPFNAFQSET